MVLVTRIWPACLMAPALLLAAACSGAAEGPEVEAESEAVEAVDPKAAAELAQEQEEAAKLAEAKPAFDAALASGDPVAVDDLADAGNAWALYHRGKERLTSHDYMMQQGGFEDMEAAADHGLPDALFWVGERYAYGTEGYKLKPNSGLMMMEKAARRGNVDAMVAVAKMYAQDAYMSDRKKARDWYQRAADAGSIEAKDVVAELDRAAAEAEAGETP